MKKQPIALGLTALLFVGWIGYLAVQAWKYRTPPVVVSRAQLLVARFDVVADVTGGVVTVKETLYPADGSGPAVGAAIVVPNLSKCDGLAGDGSYVLPLVPAAEDGQFLVAGLPFDPGREREVRPKVYPATPAVRGQFAELRK